jgi:hypothetical protein
MALLLNEDQQRKSSKAINYFLTRMHHKISGCGVWVGTVIVTFVIERLSSDMTVNGDSLIGL